MNTTHRSSDHFAAAAVSHSTYAEIALHALDDGVAVIAPDGRLACANELLHAQLRVPARSLTGTVAIESLAAFLPDAAAIEMARGGQAITHRVDGRGDDAGRVMQVTIRPSRDGTVVLFARDITAVVESERSALSRLEEIESLRIVAGLLAEETDLAQVLELISAQAASQCQADGGTVIQVEGEKGRAVASSGAMAGLRDRAFAVAGSLAERAIQQRSPVAVDDYITEFAHHGWASAAQEMGIGPVLLAPLFAHDHLMGVVAVGRRRGRAPFAPAAVRRIRAIADQAALALWKSQLLEAAEAANRAKNDFIAVMSHELRTPLAAVAGYEELLADEILGPLNGEQHNALDRMRWSTRLLHSIIEEVLTFSRLESGEVSVHAAPVRPRDIVDAAGAVLEPLANARDLDFGVSTDDDSELVTDADLVRRILVNLGSNAVKFTEKGTVRLSARREGGQVCFAVRDTGIGIAAEDLQRIFHAFTQVHSGIKRPYGGTGLGLHTAHRLAGLVGGTIRVESTLGAGSTFSLWLPAQG